VLLLLLLGGRRAAAMIPTDKASGNRRRLSCPRHADSGGAVEGRLRDVAVLCVWEGVGVLAA
jgi:hypothetical protein